MKMRTLALLLLTALVLSICVSPAASALSATASPAPTAGASRLDKWLAACDGYAFPQEGGVKYWLDTYAPKFVKFQVQEKSVPKLPLTPEQDKFLAELADLMETTEFTDAAALHDAMYEILEGQGLKPQKGFQAIYKMILGQKQGPRAASFLLSLDKDFVVKRLRKEA